MVRQWWNGNRAKYEPKLNKCSVSYIKMGKRQMATPTQSHPIPSHLT